MRIAIIKWVTRILAAAIITFGLPFYFGYGNPLPFIKPEYTPWDNMWLTIFPLMFTGLALGWKFEKTGGFLVSVPVLTGLVAGRFMERSLSIHMLIPLAVGILNIFIGFKEKRGN